MVLEGESWLRWFGVAGVDEESEVGELAQVLIDEEVC